VAGGANLYGFANGDPINGHDPSGFACEKRGSDRLMCTNLGPTDPRIIRDFLGGDAGNEAYDVFKRAGMTQWSASSCRVGFSDPQCDRMADAMSALTLSDNALCSSLGTLATRVFERGHMYFKQSTRYHGAGFGPGQYGTIWLAPGAFSKGDVWLKDMIAHEARHLQAVKSQLNPRHKDTGRDAVYNIGHMCAALP
jgi:hypothetical protein